MAPREDCEPLRARSIEGRVEVWRPDGDEPILVQWADPGRRAVIHPIISPDGRAVVTRAGAGDPPLPAGLSAGFAALNGTDFPAEGTAGAGSLHPLLVGPQHLRDGGVLWSVITDWRGPDGASLLGESQRWTVHDFGDRYDLDLLWTLSANADVTAAADTPAGPFFHVAQGQPLICLFGGQGKSADRPARWMALSRDGTGDQPEYHVTLMDHPDNPGHPPRWHLDPDRGGGPKLSQSLHLPAGEMAVFRYRAVVQTGIPDTGYIESHWRDFTRPEDEASDED